MSLAMALGAFPILIIGLIIWKFEFVEIIAGYDEAKCSDKKGMARWVGGCLIVLSIAMFANYFITKNFEIEPRIESIMTLGTFLIIITITVLGTRRYETK